MSNLAWRKEPITLDVWKANCSASSHHHKTDTIAFHEDAARGVWTCWLTSNHGASIFLGTYFVRGSQNDGILPNTGWNH